MRWVPECSRPRLAAAALLVILSLLSAAACATENDEEEITAIEDVHVEAEVALRGRIESVVSVTGVVTPAPGAELVVTAPQAARVIEIGKAPGDPVRRGDLLVRFDIPALAAEAAAATAAVQRAEAAVENARAEKERLEGLFDRGIAARKELEDARRDLADAEADLGESRIAEEAALAMRSRREVRSPFDGVVAARWHNAGDLVEPGSGDPILRVIDPRLLEVTAEVPVENAAVIHVGSPARVGLGPEDAGPRSESIDPGGGTRDEASRADGPVSTAPEEAMPQEDPRLAAGTRGQWNARVVSAPATVDPSTSTGAVRIAIDRASGLVDGTPVQVAILGEVHDDALIVPLRALVREGEGTFLYTIDEGNIAHRRAVEIGIVNGGEAEILSGVSAGDRIIVDGQLALPDGASVKSGDTPAEPG